MSFLCVLLSNKLQINKCLRLSGAVIRFQLLTFELFLSFRVNEEKCKFMKTQSSVPMFGLFWKATPNSRNRCETSCINQCKIMDKLGIIKQCYKHIPLHAMLGNVIVGGSDAAGYVSPAGGAEGQKPCGQ